MPIAINTSILIPKLGFPLSSFKDGANEFEGLLSDVAPVPA